MTRPLGNEIPEPDRTPVLRVASPVLADDPFLRERVLRPYRRHAQYLRSAEVAVDGDVVLARCRFGIDESWYIDDTGHFNAVELNISYNQAAYYLIAKSVQEQLLPVFGSWTMADYWQRQLPNVLITEMNTRYRRGIDARDYSGELVFARIRQRPARAGKAALIVLETECRFQDGNGGSAEGEVRLVITDPPGAAQW